MREKVGADLAFLLQNICVPDSLKALIEIGISWIHGCSNPFQRDMCRQSLQRYLTNAGRWCNSMLQKAPFCWLALFNLVNIGIPSQTRKSHMHSTDGVFKLQNRILLPYAYQPKADAAKYKLHISCPTFRSIDCGGHMQTHHFAFEKYPWFWIQ